MKPSQVSELLAQLKLHYGIKNPYSIAVTGHCHLGDRANEVFVAQSFHTILAFIQSNVRAKVSLFSGLALGADTLCAEAAIALGIPVEAVIAHDHLLETFPLGPARRQFERLLAQCQQVHHLPFDHSSNEAYMALGYWLVEHSDLLIAAWNGLPANGLGGTADVVAYARSIGRPVLHLHTLTHALSCA